MKLHWIIAIFLSASFSFAKHTFDVKKNTPKPSGSIKENNSYILVKKTDKGQLFFDPKLCQFKMFQNDLYFSIVNNNFLIEFPNGMTAIGDIDIPEKDKRAACFHSISKSITSGLSVIANHTDLGMAAGTVPGSLQDHSNGLINCKRRDGSTISDEIRYYPNKTSRDDATVVTIHKGSGITFFKSKTPIGNNITRKDLAFDEKFRSKCEVKTDLQGTGTIQLDRPESK